MSRAIGTDTALALHPTAEQASQDPHSPTTVLLLAARYGSCVKLHDGYPGLKVASLFRRKRAGSADPELEWVAGESTPVDDPPTAQSDLEDSSPLAERLATMQWPTPPEDVRERCLREIMNRVGQDLPNEASNADDRTAEDRRAAG